ncbi:MAG: glycoside hydrolase family 130 protein [Ignavibacteria bacterium]|nr:glycoside hydrolase family 130 protein [Ignavibacteria bacterium]
MFTKYKKNPIITPDCTLSHEKECTYNPCAIVHDKKIYLIYRAEGQYGDYISSLCLAISEDGYNFTKYKKNPIIKPTRSEEKRGCEDPRISKIGDTFYLTYTAYKSYDQKKGHKISLALATSRDLIHWKKHGSILQNTKSGYIYPEKINGEYLMFVGDSNIWIARSKNLKNWKLDEKPFLKTRKTNFDSKLVEVGPPFIEIGDKLIMIYNSANNDLIYSPSFLVLDKKNPTKILYRHNKPILIPNEQFELFGKVNNVIFAEGIVKFKNKYFLYYGGADKCIGVATTTQNEIEKDFLPALDS